MRNVSDHDLAAGREFGEALARFIVAMGKSSAPRDDHRVVPSQIAQVTQTGNEQRSLLTPRQTAKLLAISERALLGMTIPRGPLPAVRMGRLVRYCENELLRAAAQMATSR